MLYSGEVNLESGRELGLARHLKREVLSSPSKGGGAALPGSGCSVDIT